MYYALLFECTVGPLCKDSPNQGNLWTKGDWHILSVKPWGVSQGLFFSCALSHNHNMSRFNSWEAGARVCFLPKETQQQPGIDPGHRTWNLAITGPMPWPLSYYRPLIIIIDSWLLIDSCFGSFITVRWRHWCRGKTVNSCCTFLSKPRWQTLVNHFSCGFNPTLSKTFFFSFWTFLKHVFVYCTVMAHILEFCFDT